MRAVTNGLPDPADLVLETEAAAILGGKVRGSRLDGTPGRTMVWQPPSTGRPMLQVEVRHAAGAAYRQARTRRSGRLPGQPGRRGDGLGLLPVVEGRLRELAKRIDFNQY
jgi:hypothetical protein